MVTTLYSYPARGSGRRRSRQPQVSGAGGLHSAAGGGDLLVSLSGQPLVQQDHGHRAAGDGPDRAGVFSAGAASARALGGQRALGSDGRQPVSPERPQGRRHVPGHDRRRSDDVDCREGTAQLQAVAADLVPDRSKVSRRAAAEVGPAAGASVHDEGLRTRSTSTLPGWMFPTRSITTLTAASSTAAD